MRGATIPMSPGGLEAVERERVAARHDREPVGGPRERQRRDHVVGHQHAHDVGVARVREVAGREALVGGLLARRVGAHAHLHVEARVAQVERPRAPLVAVADHRHGRSGDRSEVGVVVVEDRRHEP